MTTIEEHPLRVCAHPFVRRDLEWNLRELSDRAYHESAWRFEKEALPSDRISDFSNMIALLYDDYDLRDRSNAELLGLDDSGFATIQKLMDEIDLLFDRVGDYFIGEYKTVDYMESPEWPKIVEAAKVAYEALTRTGK